VNLAEADLTSASLIEAKLNRAILSRANLDFADLSSATLIRANLCGADLTDAKLVGANIGYANLSRANLSGADLFAATLLDTDLTGADLTGCRIYGISAWDLKLEGAKQQNLLITPEDEPEITVDNIGGTSRRQREFAMFADLQGRYHWVLTIHRYDSQAQLIAELGEKVIRPAELKVLDLQGRDLRPQA
jgi:hypothetical protein